MPEIRLLCDEKEHVNAAVTVEQYRKYTELMEKNTGLRAQDAMIFNMIILKVFFEIPESEVKRADVVELIRSAKILHFVMQEVITPKFLELNPEKTEEIEQEKSAFDEYDVENGYDDIQETEAGSTWKICRENTDRIIKMCIKAFDDSVTNVMKTDIMSLLDHLVFEIRTMHENE